MGRRQTIDRGHLLDAAEKVVLRDGASSLTIDAVAKEAGVSKGGVLYAYSTKDALIEAMMARVVANYERMVAEYMEAAGDQPNAAVLAHIDAARREEVSENARAIALMATFIRAPEYHASSVEFYQGLFAHADGRTPVGRRIRLALLATEGAFVLRGFGLCSFTDADWQAIHEDIVEILLG